MDNLTVKKESPPGVNKDDLALDDLIVSSIPEGNPSGFPALSARTDMLESLVKGFRYGDQLPTIVSSAAPLLNLAHTIRNSSEEFDIQRLRTVATDAVRAYERDLASARISPERARAAHYAVCATVDDVVLNKRWGARGGWARSGLVSTFHIDVTGGDRVFDLLDHFHKSPGANKDLLLLFYLCLSLAFEGRTRVSPRGALELANIRDSLYRTLVGQYGAFERELSPHWKGIAARHKPVRTAAALWTALSLAGLLLLLGYLLFNFLLNGLSIKTLNLLASVTPMDTPSVVQLARVEPPRPVQGPPISARVQVAAKTEPSPTPPKPNPVEKLLDVLQADAENKLVTITNNDGRLVVLLNNVGLFETGKANVNPAYFDLLERIGGALAAENFRAVVVGYTDSRPINTREFPSNWHLSQARAAAVGEILALYTGPDAILTEGRADSNPIGDNNTEEGRAANRRTEILVLVDNETARKLESSGAKPAAQTDFEKREDGSPRDISGAQPLSEVEFENWKDGPPPDVQGAPPAAEARSANAPAAPHSGESE